MKQKNKPELRDVQSQQSEHPIVIHKVGVRSVPFPLIVMDKEHEVQHTVALINMYVDLPKQYRGTHMSRFIEILNEYRGVFVVRNIYAILKDIKKRLKAESAHLEASFSYFINRKAPVSGSAGLMEFPCQFITSLDGSGQRDFVLVVEVPVSTLCPCSKEISVKSAHNQRAIVRTKTRLRKLVWIEDIVELVEECASSKLFPVLKREDEKYVTEHAYDRPRFVEDVARQAAAIMDSDQNIIAYQIEVESFESIHSHNAYAEVISDNWVAP